MFILNRNIYTYLIVPGYAGLTSIFDLIITFSSVLVSLIWLGLALILVEPLVYYLAAYS